jgi:transcriptional regulator with XRE-family HTH domain
MQDKLLSKTGLAEIGTYNSAMARTLTKPRPKLGAHLAELRSNAGLSQAELAQRIGVPQQNIAYWEQSSKPPRSEILAALAQALNVRVESLLDVGNGHQPVRKGGPQGRLRKVFEEASGLPRRQQEKIAEFVSAFITQSRQGRTSP